AENIRDLQGRPCHGNGSGERLDIQIFQRAFHLAQEARRDMTVARGVLELIMSKRCWQSNPSTDATTTWPSSVTYSMTPSTRVT
ncbi:MAG TPA: hypothetical protein VLU73_14500, partial [Methylococcaceae bacterium]|nr:hypothetical protein [Methylococcaceae bacterium]